jgi:exonuclease SbcD
MRFLHTADWHLGRYFHGATLLNDQAHILDQLVSLAIGEKVDAVLIAGDIYDRAVPPADAVSLLDDVLSRLVVGAGIPVIVIAGNHDSAERIGFGGRIFQKQGLTLRGPLGGFAPVLLNDKQGTTVAIHPLPYVEPAFARNLPGAESASDHQSAMTHVVSLLQAQFVPGQRNVLLGHAFVSGGTESESERPLSVGGSGQVVTATFDGFDFVALGHLHRPQSIGSERIQYSGSLLKYSFNEVSHVKSVSIVEMGVDGPPVVQRVALSPRRDVRTIKGKLAELLARPDPHWPRDDYLCALLTDTDPVLDPMSRLREVYPHMLELQFAAKGPAVDATARAAGDHRRREPIDLFRAFYRDVAGEDIDDAALEVFSASAKSMSAGTEGGVR